MRSTGLLGSPEEYFNPRYRPLSAYARDGEIDFHAAFSSVCREAATPNGTCAFKVFPPEFEYLLTHSNFSEWFPTTRFIWLQRADILG